VGSSYFHTAATIGLYHCTATDTWTLPGGTFSGTAADVPYTQAGTGATLSNVAAKLNQMVSVKDFGAKGDNSTDDTVAVQKAITAASLIGPSAAFKGSTVYFPAGKYVISSPLILPKSGLNPTNVVHLEGDSEMSSILVGDSSFPAGTGN
jgi:hypothetical protein